MAGDTFDAGTVYAEARVDRDQARRDIAAFRRDLIKLEREARVVITPKIDPQREARRGIQQIEQMLRNLGNTTVRPRVELTGAAQVRAQARQLQQDLRRITGSFRARVEVQGLELARAGAAQLLALLRAIHGMRVRPEIELTGVAEALAQVGALAAALAALAAMNASPNVNLVGGFLGQLVGMNAGLGGLLKMLTLIPAAAALAGAGVWVLAAAVGAIAQATYAAAVLPAMLLSLVGIVATVKMGLQGVGDALSAAAAGDTEALAEAMKELAPAAREYVLEIQKLRPAYEGLQLEVQQRLFTGLGAAVGDLGRRYLPMLNQMLPNVAQELRETALQTIAVANGSRQIDSVRQVLAGTTFALDALNPAFGHLLQILLDVGAVGSQLLPGMAGGFTAWARGAAETVAAMRESGELLTMMQTGLAAVRMLWDLLANIGSILVSVFGTAASVGGNMLSIWADATGQLAAFLRSAEGTQLLVTFFTALRDTAYALQPGLAAIGDALGYVIRTVAPVLPQVAAGASVLAQALAPIVEMLAALVAGVAPPLVAFITWLGPAIGPVTAALLGMFAAFKVVAGVVAIINTIKLAWAGLMVAFAMSPVGATISVIVIAISGLVAGFMYLWHTSEGFRNFWIGLWQGIQTATAATWSFLQGAFAWLQSVPGAVAGWLSSTWDSAMRVIGESATWLYENAIRPAWDGIVMATQFLGGLLSTAWGGVTTAVQAVGAAAMWLWTTAIQPAFSAISLAARTLLAVLVTIVLAPIILAVKALGAIFLWAWDNAIGPVWDLIAAGAVAAWGIVQPILAAIGTFITTNVSAAWTGLSTAVAAAWGAITGVVSTGWAWLRDTIFQPLIDFVVGQLSQSFEGWRILVTGAWAAVQAAINIAWVFIRDTIWNPLVAFITGPLTSGFNTGRDTAVGAWQAIQNGLSIAWNFIRDNIWNPLVAFVTGVLVGAFNTARDGITTAWSAVQNALSTVWNWVRTNVFDPMANFVTVTIPNAFTRAVDGIRGAWERIQGIVAPPIKFMVGVVYNEGIVPAWNWIAKLVGLGPLEKVNLGFHSGGIVPGPAGTYTDNRLARVNGGEAVMRPEWTRAVGPRYVEDMNRLAANGGPKAVVRALNSGAIVEGADHDGPGSSTVGFGGVRPHVAQAGHYLKNRFGIGTVGGVGQRANASDHPKGLALDFMTYNDTAKGNSLVSFLDSPQNFQHFAVKYIIWRQRIANSPGAWRGMADRGSPTANHMDHPHVSFLGGAGSGPMGAGGGGFFDMLAKLTELWNKVTEFMGRVGEFTGTQWGAGGMELLKKLVAGAWDWLVSKVTGGLIGGGPDPAAADPAARTGRGGAGTFDNGGWLPTGTSLVNNFTGSPEPVLTPEQWRAITAPPPAPSRQAPPGATADQIAQLTSTMTEVRDLLERRGAGGTVNVHDSSGDPVATARAAVLQLRLS